MINKIYEEIQKKGINLDEDVFNYGMLVLNQYLIYFAIVIPISICYGMLFELAIFILVFIPLRKNLGGFHFENKKLCTLFSVLITFLILLLSQKVIFNNIVIIFFCYLFFLVITIKIKTVDHKNKKLDEKEKEKFSVKAIYIECMYFILIIICIFLNRNILSNILFFSNFFMVLSICLAYYKRLKEKKNK